MSHFKKNWKMRMSSMNEDFQDSAASLIKSEAADPSLLSSLMGKQSPPSPQSAAAALQALLDRGQANLGHSALYQNAFGGSPAKAAAGGLAGLLTSKDLAKLNLDVRNFKLQDTNSPQMQLQYNLNSLLGSNGTNLNQLLLQQAGIDSSMLSGLMNSLNTNEKLGLAGKGRQSNQGTPNKPRLPMGHRIEDEDEAMSAAMMAAAGHGLNIGLINKHNQQQRQARRNDELIKGNSMSPSPRGTSCSEETETLHSSSGSPLSSTHDVGNGVSGGISSSSSSASASGSDTGRRRRRQKEQNGGNKYNGLMANDEDGDLDGDDVDEDSRSSPNGSHSPHSSSLTHNGDNDLTANNNGDCDNSMMDNADDDETGQHNDDDELDGGEDDLDEDQFDSTNNSINNSQALANGRQRNRKGSGKSNDLSRDRNNSASSPARSSSSQTQSRSVSPSSSSAAAAAFPNLAAVAAANGIDSATAMLAAQSLLQQQTPGLTFQNLAASGLALPTVGSSKDQATTRKRRNDREAMSERIKKIKPVPAEKKDDAYWERRRKNNEAAKRSRDLRRQKEDEIAIRATFLEQENLKLKAQVTILKNELSNLHFMLYKR